MQVQGILLIRRHRHTRHLLDHRHQLIYRGVVRVDPVRLQLAVRPDRIRHRFGPDRLLFHRVLTVRQFRDERRRMVADHTDDHRPVHLAVVFRQLSEGFGRVINCGQEFIHVIGQVAKIFRDVNDIQRVIVLLISSVVLEREHIHKSRAVRHSVVVVDHVLIVVRIRILAPPVHEIPMFELVAPDNNVIEPQKRVDLIPGIVGRQRAVENAEEYPRSFKYCT